MAAARCPRFAPRRSNISFSQALTLGLTCLVSVGGGHPSTSSLTTGNKRSTGESQTNADVHQSKRPFVDNSYTNPVASQSQTKPSVVDAARWVELLRVGWTLDDADLIQDDSKISEDTQRLWWAFQKLRKELASPNPSHETVRTHFTELREHIECFMSQPRSYLEGRIFFSMARPLMPLSQYIEKGRHSKLQQYFRNYRIEALLKWLTSRNESKLLFPGVRLNTLMMEDIIAHTKQEGCWNNPRCLENDPIGQCFSALLHGTEDVDLYRECIAHIRAKSFKLDRASQLSLFVIVPYLLKSKFAKDVSSSIAESYMFRKIKRNPLLTDQSFVKKGWTLNNFDFVDETPSFEKRQATGERDVERKLFAVTTVLGYLQFLRGADRLRAEELLEGKVCNWMTSARQFLVQRQDYSASRAVVGMLSCLVDAKRYLKPELWMGLQDFAVSHRGYALKQWLNLSNDAGLLLRGQRLRSSIIVTLCHAVTAYSPERLDDAPQHGLHMILRGAENPNWAETEKQLMERQQSTCFSTQSADEHAATIVSQLFYKHANLPCVGEATLERWLVALMKRQTSPFNELVRDSGINKSLEPGCIRAAQRALDEESSDICDAIIKKIVHAYENCWATLDTPENTKAVIEHIMTHCVDFSEAELLSALTCLVCIRRCGDKRWEKDVDRSINLCEERLMQLKG